MSNLEVIQKLYEFFKARDEANIRAIFHAEIRWEQMEGFPSGGIHHGADEIFENVFRPFRSKWSNWKAPVREFIDARDRIIALGNYEGTYNETGRSVKAEFAHVYELQDGKVIRFTQYTDTALVEKAMLG